MVSAYTCARIYYLREHSLMTAKNSGLKSLTRVSTEGHFNLAREMAAANFNGTMESHTVANGRTT